ncbi:MAG: hypothetical protein AB7L09_10705 [Nitrospira sp.]|mgnify:CR=1 FL=1|jgi:hypothetical protein
MKTMARSNLPAIMACLLLANEAQYVHDELGRLSQVIDGQGNVCDVHLPSITYNTSEVGIPTVMGLTSSKNRA